MCSHERVRCIQVTHLTAVAICKRLVAAQLLCTVILLPTAKPPWFMLLVVTLTRRPAQGFIKRLPGRIKPVPRLLRQHPRLLHALKEAGSAPLLEAVVDRAASTQCTGQSLPVATHLEDVIDSGHGPAVIHTWPPGLLLGQRRRQQRHDLLP